MTLSSNEKWPNGPVSLFEPGSQGETKESSRHLLEILRSFFIARCVATVAELRIADLLTDEGKTVEELAYHAGADPQKLQRILRALHSVGIFAQDEDNRFMLTPLSHWLRSDVEGSLRSLSAFMGHTRTWSAWGELAQSARVSASGFEIAAGMKLFEYLADDNEYHTLFNDAMRDLAAQSYSAVVAAYDFSDVGTVMDVGGGTGTFLALILKNNNQLRGMLFDLPYVVAQADPVLEAHHVKDRCTKLEGDFFRSVPAGADAYILATVVHDWDDEQVLIILRNCRRVIPKSGILLLIETIIPDTGANYTNVLDIEMLVMTSGGCERTIPQYRRLFSHAGFELTKVVSTDSDFCIIEGRPS